MLGIDKVNVIIKEPFASQIREKLYRYRNNELNEEDRKHIERTAKILKKYKAIWVDYV
jgi:hypothetical protein